MLHVFCLFFYCYDTKKNNVCSASFALKTLFVDIEKDHAHCSRAKNATFYRSTSYPTPYLNSGSLKPVHDSSYPSLICGSFTHILWTSDWICMEYLPLNVKQPTLSQLSIVRVGIQYSGLTPCHIFVNVWRHDINIYQCVSLSFLSVIDLAMTPMTLFFFSVVVLVTLSIIILAAFNLSMNRCASSYFNLC